MEKISEYGLTGGVIDPSHGEGDQNDPILLLIKKRKTQGWIFVPDSDVSEVVAAHVDDAEQDLHRLFILGGDE